MTTVQDPNQPVDINALNAVPVDDVPRRETQAELTALQGGAVAAEQGTPGDDYTLQLSGKSWPLVTALSFARAAAITKAASDGDLTGMAVEIPKLVLPEYRDKVTATILADVEPGDPGFLNIEDVVDAFGTAMGKISGRPTDK